MREECISKRTFFKKNSFIFNQIFLKSRYAKQLVLLMFISINKKCKPTRLEIYENVKYVYRTHCCTGWDTVSMDSDLMQ